jgi:hypothetical protein
VSTLLAGWELLSALPGFFARHAAVLGEGSMNGCCSCSTMCLLVLHALMLVPAVVFGQADRVC